MKGFLRFSLAIMITPLVCGTAFVIGYVTLVALTIPQLPDWAQAGVTDWLLDIPQHSESTDNGKRTPSRKAGIRPVGWADYKGSESGVHGLPLFGPVQHWSTIYDRPLLGCVFQDSHYRDHTGVDLPVNEGTPVHTTLAGQVVWAGENGPWGNLVVIENDGFQVWLAHLSSIEVSAGDLLEYGAEIGLSGDTGNSSGPHLHYAIRSRTEAGSFVWLDPRSFFLEDDVIQIGCGG